MATALTGDDVRDWRKAHALTQIELAQELDVSRQTVIGWEATEGEVPRLLQLALRGLELSRSVAGKRASAPEYRELRARPSEPGSMAARKPKTPKGQRP